MTTRKQEEQTIAIIGGGVSGALTAYQLFSQGALARIVVIDPRVELGLGLAYSTPSLRHLLNVPANKISALPDDDEHFVKWLRLNFDPEATAMTFAPRAMFGKYVRSLLTGVEHLRACVTGYRPTASGAVLTLDDGRELRANFVVLATGNFDPAPLTGVTKEAEESEIYQHNAWKLEALKDLSPDAPITLIGTGLTAVDVVLRLRELGHRGAITAISRHSMFPARHAPYTPLNRSAIPAGTPATCVAYLRALRGVIHNGADWRAAIDSLRAVTNDLWLALPVREQRRFRRHLQRRWDTVRHRMAPTIADVIDSERTAGTLLIREGHLASVENEGTGARVTIRTRGRKESFATSRVINCTGPSINYRQVKSPLMQSLFDQRLATEGLLGGGFRCSPTGAMIDENGESSGTLFNLGPGRLGTLLESIAVPEIRQQALELATLLTAHAGQFAQQKKPAALHKPARQAAVASEPMLANR